MAIASYSTYRAKFDAPRQRSTRSAFWVGFIGYSGVSNISVDVAVGAPVSDWVVGLGGAAPTTAVVPTRATAGCVGQQNSSGTQRLVGGVTACGGQNRNRETYNSTVVVCDRLSHQGGLSGTSILTQTTNLPTAALTRYTSGEGVHAALEIYTGLGVTLTTVTAVYTNQAGIPGTTPATDIGGGFGTTYRGSAGFILPLSLASGDSGFRGVTSVILAASTGSVGNFGVTLYKPLMTLPALSMQRATFDALLDGGGNLPVIVNDACLFTISIINDGGTTFDSTGVHRASTGHKPLELIFTED